MIERSIERLCRVATHFVLEYTAFRDDGPSWYGYAVRPNPMMRISAEANDPERLLEALAEHLETEDIEELDLGVVR